MLQPIRETARHLLDAVPFRIVPAIVTTLVLVSMLMAPTPAGLTDDGWAMLAIFLTTIVAIILKVMPIGVMALMAMVIVSLAQVTSPTSRGAVADALGSFSSPLIWLIVIAILISIGLKKSGLGKRVGLNFIALVGRRTIGIGYALAACELLLAPVTPSNTARGGGIVHPIMRSIAGAFDSDPAKGSEGKVGTYLALVNYHANPITSAMFLTATAPNPLVQDFLSRASGGTLNLGWTGWALAMLVPGLLAILVMPLIIYLLSPPQVKETPDAVAFARSELARMGPLSSSERVMTAVFALLLVLWANLPAMILGDGWLLDPTMVALLGLFLLVITGTIDWNDVLGEKSAWDTLIWFGALVMMAEQLNRLGVIAWFSGGMDSAIASAGLSWPVAAGLLVLVFTFSHYFFASTTAHISAMMFAFLTVGVGIVPPEYQAPFMLLMAAASAIMMTLTHYATGTSPIIFGSGYVTMGRWWSVGFAMCVIELAIFATVGCLWWRFLGYW